MGDKKIRTYSFDESVLEKFDTLFEYSDARTKSDLLSELICEAYDKSIDDEAIRLMRIEEKLDRILKISNENNLYDYEIRDALNSLITYYEPTTGFVSADEQFSNSALHDYILRSKENYLAKLHARTIESKGMKKGEDK